MNKTTSPARIAPAAEAPELTEHVHVLMTPELRAFLLGSKIEDSARSEGAVARALLESAAAAFQERSPQEHARRVRLGKRELARRAAVRAA